MSNKTWVHAPIWLNDPRVTPTMCKLSFYLITLSFFDNKDQTYLPMKYELGNWSIDLNMSKTTIINNLKSLDYLGYIVKNGSEIQVIHTAGKFSPKVIEHEHIPKIETVSKIETTHENDSKNWNTGLKKCNDHSKNWNDDSKNWNEKTLYDRFTEGFPTLIVFKEYIYSNNIVPVVDLLKIIENMEKLEVLKTLRKETTGKNLDGFEKNDTFQQCVQWIKEIYNDPPDDGQELPVDRYLLYFLIQCIETKNNPAGMFITAVKKLKTDGTRFELDMKEFEKHQQKVDAKEMMQKSIENTRKMLNALDEKERQAIAEEQETDLLFQNNPDLVKAMAPVALEEARKKYGVFALGAKKVDENGNDITEKRERIIQRMARGILKQFILDEKKNTKVG